MRNAIRPSNDDLDYFLAQNTSETERIVAIMTSIIDDNSNNLYVMQNQKWFQRIWLTITGKNKATIEEMKKNRDKLFAYNVQVFCKLMEKKSVSDAIISSLTIRLNEIYSSHVHLKIFLHDIIAKLNAKIDSVNNYHNLITDIQNDKYDPKKTFLSLLVIFARLDKQTVSDSNNLRRIKETMITSKFDFSATVNIGNFTEQILTLPDEFIGQVYLFTQNHTKFKFVQFACCLIAEYHFEPKSNQNIVKESAIKKALAKCSLKGNEICEMEVLYEDIQNSIISNFETINFVSAEERDKNTDTIKPNPILASVPVYENDSNNKSEKCKNSFEKKIESEYERQKKEVQKPNLMLVGGTGTGKSSLINRVFGKKIAVVGAGLPITKGVIKYEDEKYPIVFWDTEGYEIRVDKSVDKSNFDNVIKSKIEEMNRKELKDAIHLVWYCLQISTHRVTDYDMKNIKWFKERNMKIAIVFTKCDRDSLLSNNKGATASAFQSFIEAKIPGLQYFETCAEKEEFPLDLDVLLEWSIDKLPNDQMRASFIEAQKISLKSKKKEAYKIVKTAAITVAFTAGFNPLPLSDTIFIVPQQLAMAVSLSKIFMFDSLSENIGNLLKTQIATLAGRVFVSSLLKLIPLLGNIINALVAGGLTYALGMALTEAYSNAYENFIDKNEKPDWEIIFTSDLFMNSLTSSYQHFMDKKGKI